MIIQWILLNKIQGFIKWKKLYYETKHDPEKTPSEIKFSHDSSLLDIARCVLNIGMLEMSLLLFLRHVNREFSSQIVNTSLKPLLRKHPQRSCVSGLAKQHQIENIVSNLNWLINALPSESTLLWQCFHKTIHLQTSISRILSLILRSSSS